MSPTSKLSGAVEILDHEKILLGKDGFIFQRFDQTFEQLCGNTVVRSDEIQRWVGLIESRFAWCQAREIPYIFAVTPEKHAIYPDCLPHGFTLNENRPVKRIFEGLLPSVRSSCLYYDDALRQGRKRGDTFYRTDIHWTQLGACVAYNEIARTSNGRLPEQDLSALKTYEKDFTGEFSFYLKERISEKATFVEHTPPRKYKKVFSKRSFKEGQVEVYETDGAPQGTLVFFRDSNGTALLPYLLPHFSRSVVVASSRMFREVVEVEPSALVITQMAERYLGRLDGSGRITLFPDDFAEIGFVEATGVPLPLPNREQTVLDIDLRSGGNAKAFLGPGWSNAEPEHRWATGSQCIIELPASALDGPTRIEFAVQPFIDLRSHPRQRATIFLNDIEMESRSIASSETIFLVLPEQLQGKSVSLKIVTPDAVAPRDVGHGEERRVVSFLFDHIFVRRLS